MLALVDNTVLSNFAMTDAIPLLCQVLGKEAATVKEVLDEFTNGVALNRLPPTDLSCLRRLTLNTIEATIRLGLRPQLGLGEAACLAVAFVRGGSVFTDDRTARKVATQMQIPISGTIGILMLLVHRNMISLQEGDALLSQMIGAGYHSPVATLSEAM